MYTNIEVNHTNIEEYLRLAEIRIMDENATDEDFDWYVDLMEKQKWYSSDIGSLIIESELARQESRRLQEESRVLREKSKQSRLKIEKVLNILDTYKEELPKIISNTTKKSDGN